LTKYSYVIITLTMALLMAVSLGTIFALGLQKAYSDSLTGGTLTQRIGNVNVELKTVPAEPLAGERAVIFLRFGSINGEDLIDTPINIRITKQGEEVHKTQAITVPDGHYTYSYQFAEPDTYGITIEIEGQPIVAGSGSSSSSLHSSKNGTQSLLFTFPVGVISKLPFGLSSFQISLVIAIGITVFVIFFFYRRRTRNATRTSYEKTGKN
jgi:hypothetical protein